MSTLVNDPAVTERTMADAIAELGDVPLSRIPMTPPPGTATVADVVAHEARTGRTCELIDGVLVEKTVGYYESIVGLIVARLIGNFVAEHDLGIVLGADGPLRLLPHQVRVPDVGFISWSKFPGRKLPPEPIPSLAPDLAVEILSASNTPGEMRRKLHDYFEGGVRLVWYIDPESRSAVAYTSPEQSTQVRLGESLSGHDVLPGFELPLQELFVR